MIKMKKIAFLTTCLFFNQCYCKNDDENRSAREYEEPKNENRSAREYEESKELTCDSNTSKLLASTVLEAENKIKKIIDKIPEDCSDKKDPNSFLCEDIKIKFSTKEGSPSSRGQRILIMDKGFHIPAMTRFNSRVLDFVEFTPDGLKTTKETLIANRAASEIVSLLDEKYPILPNILLKSIGKQLAAKVDSETWFKRTSGEDLGHGTTIFTQLADYNPYAEFVLIDDENFKESEEAFGIDLCKIDTDSTEFDRYKNYISSVSGEIIELVKKYDINFINFSFSPDIQDISRQLKSKCKRDYDKVYASKLLQIYLDEFFKPLYSIPDVIAVQAVLQTKDFTPEHVQDDHRIDCTKFNNRIRVIGFGMLDSQISKDGSSDSRLISKMSGALPCADLAINLGEDGGPIFKPTHPKCFVHFNYIPLQEPEPPTSLAISSSYAAPVAVSYLIYLKNTLPPNTPTEEIIRIATEGGNFIRDPIRHRQIEVYRMKYLDP